MAYTFLNLAEEVLLQSNVPMTYQEIWNSAKELGLNGKLRSVGKTPWQTLGARLFVEVRDNQNTVFVKVGQRPTRFYLAAKQQTLPNDIIDKLRTKSENKMLQPDFKERILHPLLAYFVYSNPLFKGGKGVLTKTIYHEKSSKKGYNEWLHPDMVGFYLPLNDWNKGLIDFNRISENNILKLYSFELKKSINKATYRESFFQAVSNSSWANEGYLVTPFIQEDDDLLNELERLSMSFGIGIIHLDLEDIDSSKIIYPSKTKSNLDWETMNKLSDENPDFNKFLEDVKIDFESQRIHKTEYEKIIDNPEEYISKNIFKKNVDCN